MGCSQSGVDEEGQGTPQEAKSRNEIRKVAGMDTDVPSMDSLGK